jgi:rhodanese-related sulfurtransferase
VSVGVTADDLGRKLYRSVHVLLNCPTDLVLPAHGVDACGKALSTETVSTIGEQRRTNYAVQPMSEAAFIELVTETARGPPTSSSGDAEPPERPLLHEGERSCHRRRFSTPPSPPEQWWLTCARSRTSPAATWPAAERRLRPVAEQVGSIVPSTRRSSSSARRGGERGEGPPARIGFDTSGSWPMQHVLEAASERSGRLSRLTARPADRQPSWATTELVDVRNPGEVTAAPVDGARTIPLAHLRSRLGELDRDRPVVLVCAGGARSAIASSLLRSLGFADVSDVLGGATALGASPSCSTAG